MSKSHKTRKGPMRQKKGGFYKGRAEGRQQSTWDTKAKGEYWSEEDIRKGGTRGRGG